MKIRVVAALFMISLLVSIAGCGGSSGDSGPLFNPDELEVMNSLDAFAAAIRDENRGAAMGWVDSNLKWGSLTNPMFYDNFSNKLGVFFNNNQVNDFRLDNMGISVFDKNATVRAQLVCKYVKAGETVETVIAESIEIKLEKLTKWGILEAYSNSSASLQFPPE